MCVVIDMSCLAKVLDIKNADHGQFRPVLDWITKGRGRVVYGGTKYKRELKKAGRYLSILIELNRKGRVIELPDGEVDVAANEIRNFVNQLDFNDEHLIAIVRVARCVVVCINDRTAERYLKRRELYPKNVMVPKIYKRAEHKPLCCDANVVGVCASGE